VRYNGRSVPFASRSLVFAFALAIAAQLVTRQVRATERHQISIEAARVRILRADADVASCVSVTPRAPDAIIVRASLYTDDAPGITIVEGETLCLAAEVGDDGSLRKVHLANLALGEPTLVRLRLDPPGSPRRLHVEVASELGLFHFTFGTAVAPPDAEQPPDFIRIRSVVMGAWHDEDVRDPSVREVLITDLAPFPRQLVNLPAARYQVPSQSFATRSSGGELSMFSRGVRFQHLAGVDRALSASGHDPFPPVAPSLGVVLGLAVRRWQLRIIWDGAWTSASSRTGPATVHANLLSIALEGGYDFLRWRGLTGFALVGVGAGTFTMDAHGPNWDYLGGGTATLGNPTTIERDTGLFTFGAGFEQFIPTWSVRMPLVVSIQGGYTQAFAGGSWSSSENKNSVPDPNGGDFSGSWIRIGLGMAFLDY
jgi:hypothetical protein